MILRHLFLLILFTTGDFGQITPRNLLSTHYKLDDVRRELISKNDWKPYPKTTAECKARNTAVLQRNVIIIQSNELF